MEPPALWARLVSITPRGATTPQVTLDLPGKRWGVRTPREPHPQRKFFRGPKLWHPGHCSVSWKWRSPGSPDSVHAPLPLCQLARPHPGRTPVVMPAASLACTHQPLHLLLPKPLLALPPVVLQEVILIVTDLRDAVFPLPGDRHPQVPTGELPLGAGAKAAA